MKAKIISSAVLMTLILGMGLITPTSDTWAQEKAEDEEKLTEEERKAAAARARFGPTKVSINAGDHEIFLLTSALKAEGVDYDSVETLKDGEVLLLTKSQSIKLSTEANLNFGDVVAVKENVAPNYPGVYSLWIKKSGNGWKMIINKKPDLWGTMYRPSEDVGESNLKYETNSEPSEKLTFELACDGSNGTLSILFGKHKWSTPFTVVD
ncbi:MAG: hypothetical protein COA73_12285 [Candidatus Hydrogenedentota bacterium]|nr:MAG: hypothetical protein COA73_12285 [Candidatus Hydrogenedentota bacterium]